MASDVERIKDKLPIEEVVGAYVKLERSGGRLKGRCPFHNERTPSFFVSPERGSYYCFGCGVKGDIFTFVQEFEGLDFVGALKTLASRAGIELTNEPRVNAAAKSEKEALYEILERATLYYQKQLAERKDVIEYLKGRGMTIATIKSWRIGFAPDSWRALSEALIGKGYDQALIEKAGLSKPSEKNPKERYDRFRSRVMFPLMDISGRVVGFTGRIYGDDKEAAKYLNSPETPLFDKSSFLYGFDKAKLAIRQKNQAILVEGQMDLIMSHQAGVANAVAVSGTALSEKHIDTLKRFADELVLAFDADNAGEKASDRAWQMALGKGLELKVCSIEGGKDPADLVKEDPDLWIKALAKNKHIVEQKIEKAEKISDDRARAKYVEEIVLPYVAVIDRPLEQQYFINMIQMRAGIDLNAINKSLKSIQLMREHTVDDGPAEKKHRYDRADLIERKVASLLVWLPGHQAALPGLVPADLEKQVKEASGPRAELVLSLAKQEKDELLFEAEASFEGAANLAAEVKDLVRSLEEESLKKQLSGIMISLRRAEEAKDTKKVAELLQATQELSNRLHTIKNNI